MRFSCIGRLLAHRTGPAGVALAAGAIFARSAFAQQMHCGDPLCNPMAGGHLEGVWQGADIHFKVLRSPRRQAHAEVFGVSFAYVLHSSGGSVITPANEIWLLNPDGQIAIRLLQGSGTNFLDCVEHPDVGVYLEAVHSGTQMVFSPTFGGHGTLESGLEI